MKRAYRGIFNRSYQRAISPDFHGFFAAFYDRLRAAEPEIGLLFAKTDMDRQIRMLMASMTHVISFSNTLEAKDDLKQMAQFHGAGKLDLPSHYYDVWLRCLLDTVSEHDAKYDEHVETAWKVVLSPGVEYMKSFCRRKAG